MLLQSVCRPLSEKVNGLSARVGRLSCRLSWGGEAVLLIADDIFVAWEEDGMEEKVLTRHPDPGKQGVRISKVKYHVVRQTILEILRANGELTFTEIADAAKERLEGEFEGSISWYVTIVKLDLEARNEIQRVPKTKPQRLRVVTG